MKGQEEGILGGTWEGYKDGRTGKGRAGIGKGVYNLRRVSHQGAALGGMH